MKIMINSSLTWNCHGFKWLYRAENRQANVKIIVVTLDGDQWRDAKIVFTDIRKQL